MKKSFFLSLLAIGLSGILSNSVSAEELLNTDFSDGTTQEWEQRTMTLEHMYAGFEVVHPEDNPAQYVLRIDDTIRTGENEQKPPAATHYFDNQTDGVIQQSLSIRFLDTGGLGDKYQADVRVSLNGTGTGTYIRLRPGSVIQYYDRLQPPPHNPQTGNMVIEYDVWYDLVQTVDIATSTFSFKIQNRADRAQSYQSPADVPTYNEQKHFNRVEISNVGGRQGLFEIADVVVKRLSESTE